MTACETFPDGFSASTHELSTSAFGTMQRPSIKFDFANLTDLSVKTDDVKELKLWWREMQIDYMATSLAKLNDRLPTISEIAKHFHRITNWQYYAGLWSEELERQLLWYCVGSPDGTKSHYRPEPARAPS